MLYLEGTQVQDLAPLAALTSLQWLYLEAPTMIWRPFTG